jgi:hypothetical protein
VTKPTITKLFVGGVSAFIAGVVLVLVAIFAALASDVFQMNGPDVVGVNSSGLAWSLVGVAIIGVLAAIGGAIAGLVSWIGALLNTVQLEDKAWFIVLLILGLFSFGFVAMIAYLIAGPDGARDHDGSFTVHASW